jgi:riboflavin biosynthesis pyrimidine reductase
MHLLFSRASSGAGRELGEADLVELYRHQPTETAGRARLRSNFVTSLDGSIVGPDGRSGSINTRSDHYVFALHRAAADAILVGAGTVRAEGYRAVDLAGWQLDLRSAVGLAPYPVLVIVSGSGRLDPAIATPVGGAGGSVLVLTTAGKPPEAVAGLRGAGVEVVEMPGGEVDLVQVSALLADRGLSRVLCEGGPRLNRDLLAEDLVDEISLTLAPVVVGGRGQRSTSGAALPAIRGFVLQHVLYADDETLLTHYRRP